MYTGTFRPWKVCHIELNEGISSLPAEPAFQGLYLIFWWHDIPVGELEISSVQLPMPVSQLINLIITAITPAVGDHLFKHGFKARLPVLDRIQPRDNSPDLSALITLNQPLEQLWKCLSLQRDAASSSVVSVVICTRDRPELLERCLKSIQKSFQRPYEILVVDNAPTSNATRRLVGRIPGVRYIKEPRLGLSYARNKGIENSRGDIIAFTDDDVVVHTEWVSRLLSGFDNPQIMAVTGLMLPAELKTEAQLLFHRGSDYSKWGYRTLTFDAEFFEQMKYRGVPVWRIGAGANMAFRRQAFHRVGYFDERLGAGASGCSEDSELWYRLLAGGWLCRYEPTAVVYHYHRREMHEFKHQMYQYMQGHMAALLIQFEKYRHWGNLCRAFGILPWYYMKRIRGALGKYLRGSRSELDLLGAQILGCVAGVMYYLFRRKHPCDSIISVNPIESE